MTITLFSYFSLGSFETGISEVAVSCEFAIWNFVKFRLIGSGSQTHKSRMKVKLRKENIKAGYVKDIENLKENVESTIKTSEIHLAQIWSQRKLWITIFRPSTFWHVNIELDWIKLFSGCGRMAWALKMLQTMKTGRWDTSVICIFVFLLYYICILCFYYIVFVFCICLIDAFIWG